MLITHIGQARKRKTALQQCMKPTWPSVGLTSIQGDVGMSFCNSSELFDKSSGTPLIPAADERRGKLESKGLLAQMLS